MPTPELVDFVELSLDRQFRITMTGQRDPKQTFDDGNSRPTRSKPYDLSCSVGFLRGCNGDDSRVERIATVTDLIRLHCESRVVPPSVAGDVVEQFEKRVRQLLEKVLSGYFYIGPVRQAYASDRIGEDTNEEPRVERRHVGAEGQSAWLMERQFAMSLMRDGSTPETFQPNEFGCGIHCLFPFDPPRQGRLARIWELAADEPKRAVERLLAEHKKAQDAHALAEKVGGDAEEAAWRAYTDWRELHHHEMMDCMASLLNSVLDQRDLFAPCLPHIGIEQAYYVQGLINSLSGCNLALVNRFLIESALSHEAPDPAMFCWSLYWFAAYVSRWMRNLTEVQIAHRYHTKTAVEAHPSERLYPADSMATEAEQSYRPCGFLFKADFGNLASADGLHLGRLLHPCFGAPLPAPQPPRQMSSGFHQVFPIVVQLGLMRRGELVGIENPEVHLHPSLQLKITEALVAHAKSGRRILVETHSDLVIRRVIRAILEEELKQAEVQIYFTDLDGIETAHCQGEKTTFAYSALKPIAVDGRGRIANWPDGFLGDDVRESQRLLDIMYGGPDSGGDDDE